MPDGAQPVNAEELTDLFQLLVQQGYGADIADALRKIRETKFAEPHEVAEADYKYWAFISYSHQDAEWGNWVHRTLENYRVPANLVGRATSSGIVPKRVFPIFRDREELGAASELTDEISAALAASRFLVVVCSVASAQSQWVDAEIKRFKSIYGSQRILCIIVDGEPNAWDGSEECFPDSIRYEVTSEGELTNRPCEPIAADARRKGDGRFNAKLKLLSGLLGVKYDELRQREKFRRRRSQFAWASTAVTLLILMALGGIYLYRGTDANRLVDTLLKADTNEVPSISSELSNYRVLAHDKLRSGFTHSPKGSDAKLHAALVLLGRDNDALPYLKEQLLEVSAEQFQTVRDLMEGHKHKVIEDYWDIAKNQTENEKRRFRSACALASYDPKDAQWANLEFTTWVADELVAVLPSKLLPSRNALIEVREALIGPLSAIYRNRDRDPVERRAATDILVHYLRDDPDRLFDLLADSNEKQFELMFNRLLKYKSHAIELGNAEITKLAPNNASDADKDAQAIRKANAAVMLLRMGSTDRVWPLLRHSPDPRVRSFIIHFLADRKAKADAIITRYERESDVTVKRALLLCLGEFKLSESLSEPLTKKLLIIYQSDPDAGIHAAAEWLLRKWEKSEELDAVDSKLSRIGDQDGSRNWFINTQGQTFTILDAGEFQMGSPDTEAFRQRDEHLHRRQIGRRVAIATKEVTVGQYQEFLKQNPAFKFASLHKQEFAPTDDCPQVAVPWFGAVAYCRWLSELEGFEEGQMCYPELAKIGPNMTLPSDYLSRAGYRLPSEAEWEFACRSGSNTCRYYGSSDDLLGNYCWYRASSNGQTWPVGSLKPNDAGVFDILGNAKEWCQNRYTEYTLGSWDQCREEASDVGNWYRIIRGGSLDYPPYVVRAARRSSYPPNSYFNTIGFRIARTYESSP